MKIITGVIQTIGFGYITVESLIFLFTYHDHQGYEYGVFGYPTSIGEVSFYAAFGLIGLTASYLLLRRRILGWYLSQILVFSSLALISYAIVVSFSTSLSYNTTWYYLLTILLIILMSLTNFKKYIESFGLERSIGLYVKIIFGVLIFGGISFVYFLTI